MKSIISIFALFIIVNTAFGQKQDVDVFEKKEGNKVIVVARNTGKVEYAVTVNITSKGMDVLPASTVETKVGAGFMKEMATLTPRPGESWEYSYEVSISQTTSSNTVTPATTPTPAKSSQNTTTAKEIKSPTTNKANTTTPVNTKDADPYVSNSNTSTTNTRTTTSTSTTVPASASGELSKADLVVYTKPGCSRCEYVKKQLKVMGIPFEEYSTASSSPEINNMWAGIRSAGFTGGSVTMPVVRTKGKYFYNIPDMQGFVEKLKKG